jgi:hypothetical protein
MLLAVIVRGMQNARSLVLQVIQLHFEFPPPQSDPCDFMPRRGEPRCVRPDAQNSSTTARRYTTAPRGVLPWWGEEERHRRVKEGTTVVLVK